LHVEPGESGIGNQPVRYGLAMTANFSVQTDPERGLLIFELEGFFTVDAVASLAAERDAALAKLGTEPNRHVTLCDVSRCKIQPQEIVEAFRSMLIDPRVAAARLAIVTGSSLARMQVRRLVDRPNLAFFPSRRQAEVWLFADTRAA